MQSAATVFVLGFAGGISSGKTVRSKHIESLALAMTKEHPAALSVELINADLVGHSAYAPGTPAYFKVVEHFGEKVLRPPQSAGEAALDAPVVVGDTPINRKTLGGIVFADKSQLRALNEIVWPAIRSTVAERIANCGERLPAKGPAGERRRATLVLLEAALLVEVGLAQLCDEIWLTSVAPAIAIERIMARDGASKEEAERRLASQLSVEERIASIRDGVMAEVGSLCKRYRHFDTSRHATLEKGLEEISNAFAEFAEENIKPLLLP